VKILTADDDPVFRRLLEATLTKWGYDVRAVEDGNQAWEAMQADDAPHLAILDWVMPGLDGLEICRKLRKRIVEEYVYVILLTSQDSTEQLTEGLEAGADDYIVKPLDLQELKMRLRAARRILDLQSAFVNARESLRAQASHDSLTGLPNRAGIIDILRREMLRAKRDKMCLCVFMVDLDNFKRVNDSHGHVIGDGVLRQAAEKMVDCVRPYDAVGRYGGDEFLFVVPGCDALKATRLAERIREGFSADPLESSVGPLRVTISLGVATTDDTASEDEVALIHAADVALYQAKRAGRNSVAVAWAPRPGFAGAPSDHGPAVAGGITHEQP
jgi:diguanylate cyclase (GGDEF)-like protein